MKKIALLVVVAMGISTATFAQKNKSINLKKGQKYLLENKISTKSSTEMQGQAMESAADVNSTYNIEVKDIVSNNYSLSNTVTTVKMNMTQMGQEMNFDSEKKEDLDGPIGSSLKDYINHPKNIVIDKSGNVIPEKNNGKTDSVTDAANMITKQLGNFDATGYGAEMAFEALPEKIKAGNTWTSKVDNEGISKTTNYSVTAINGNIATVATSGTIASDTKMDMQGMEITTKTTGKFSGEEKVDIKTGVIQSNTTTTDASGIVGVMGQELPTSSTITSTTTVKAL